MLLIFYPISEVLRGDVCALSVLGNVGSGSASDALHGVLVLGEPTFLRTLLTHPVPVMEGDLTVLTTPVPLSETSNYRLVFMHKNNLPSGFEQY